jgi:hypothetical protein
MFGCKGLEPDKNLLYRAKIGDLNVKQRAIYDRIKSLPSTSGIEVYQLNVDALRNKNGINLKFTVGDKTVSIPDCVHSEGQVSDSGVDDNCVVLLVRDGKNMNGLIYSDKSVYSVEPLGESFVVICRINQSKFPKD